MIFLGCQKQTIITPDMICNKWVIQQPVNYKWAVVNYIDCNGHSRNDTLYKNGQEYNSDTITCQAIPQGYSMILKDSVEIGQPINFHCVK